MGEIVLTGPLQLLTGHFTGPISKKARPYWVLTGLRLQPP